jgi:hypothetical protein
MPASLTAVWSNDKDDSARSPFKCASPASVIGVSPNSNCSSVVNPEIDANPKSVTFAI